MFCVRVKYKSILASFTKFRLEVQKYIKITNLWIFSNLFSLSSKSGKNVAENLQKCSLLQKGFKGFIYFFLPILLKADVVSHPVNAWKKTNAWARVWPNDSARFFILIFLWFFLMPYLMTMSSKIESERSIW